MHHSDAADWFATLSPDTTFAFGRFTQLGLLRLLTAEAVMRDEVMTQPQAWAAYDRWLGDPRVEPALYFVRASTRVPTMMGTACKGLSVA